MKRKRIELFGQKFTIAGTSAIMVTDNQGVKVLEGVYWKAFNKFHIVYTSPFVHYFKDDLASGVLKAIQ